MIFFDRLRIIVASIFFLCFIGIIPDKLHSLDTKSYVYYEAADQVLNKNTMLNPSNMYSLNEFQNFIRGNVTMKSDMGDMTRGVIKLEGQLYPASFYPASYNTPTIPVNSATTNTSKDKIFLKEIYVQNSNDLFSLRAGKQYIKWGSGFFFNPIDIINYKRDPLRPLDEAEGNSFVQLSIPVGNYLSFDFFTVVNYVDSNGMDNNTKKISDLPVIPKISYSLDKISLFGFLQYKHAEPVIYGANAEYALSPVQNSSLTLYAQSTYKSRTKRNVIKEDDNIFTVERMDGKHYYAVLYGQRFQYNFTSTKLLDEIEFIVEYYYNKENWNKKDYENYMNFLEQQKKLDDMAAATNKTYYHFTALNLYQNFKNSRDYIYMMLYLHSLFTTDLAVGSDFIFNIRDRSWVIIPGISYKFNNNNAEIGFKSYIYRGSNNSEFGSNLAKFMALAYIQNVF